MCSPDLSLDITNFCVQCVPVRLEGCWHLKQRLGAFSIWIDAVGIDQEKTEEREQQIVLMGQFTLVLAMFRVMK
jgi:hypothetical protein